MTVRPVAEVVVPPKELASDASCKSVLDSSCSLIQLIFISSLNYMVVLLVRYLYL